MTTKRRRKKHPPSTVPLGERTPSQWGLGHFARTVLGKPLYRYQELIGEAIIDSVMLGRGLTFTVMLARQMGKNQLSAILESYLLANVEGGTIIKAAPTFKPQIINSRQRLLSMLEIPLFTSHLWKSFGYMVGLAPSPELVDLQAGPRVLFFSAGPESHIVGATASLLLEIDEAQDVNHEKYDVEIKPMASTTNATTVLYGTAWSDDTLLAHNRLHNLELEQQDGIKRHFEFDWQTLAAINPRYKHFVENEIARLGEDHISIRTQYRLMPISGAGFLLNDLQRHLLRGTHQWQSEPGDNEGGEGAFEGYYIAGMDVGGEERPKPGEVTQSKRDSTVLTIGRVTFNEFDLPSIQIVHQYWWTGMHYLDQYAASRNIIERWNIRCLVIDNTGLGEGLASLLIEKFGEERVTAYRFTRPSKSKLTYQFLGMVNSARLKLYKEESAPVPVSTECWKQLRLARYAIPGEGLMTMQVDASEGHDDFLISLALCCEAVREVTPPVRESAIIKPRRLYEHEGRF